MFSSFPDFSPLMYTLLIVYFITSAITVFDTRLIQARKNGVLPATESMLPSWVGIIAWLNWIVLISLFLLDWKIGICAFVVKFVLSVLPILEVIGNVIMSPFKSKS